MIDRITKFVFWCVALTLGSGAVAKTPVTATTVLSSDPLAMPSIIATPPPLSLSAPELVSNSTLANSNAANLEVEPAVTAQTSMERTLRLNAVAEPLDLNPNVIENSPLLQRWIEGIPDVQSDIRYDPSFRTRLRLGYSQFSDNDTANELSVGVEDVFVGRSGLTVSGEYRRTLEDDRDANHQRESYGADLRYYLLPLGNNINVSPLIGYRHLEIQEHSTEGASVGLRVLLSLSRTGAADISLSQSWVAPGSDDEVGLTSLSLGYALTHQLRLSTDIQHQNAPQSKDSRLGIILEWML